MNLFQPDIQRSQNRRAGLNSPIFLLSCFLILAFNSVSHADNDNITVKGYLTLEYEISNKDSAGKRGTFDLHHFNVLSNYQINDNSRVFGEIEWEHGTALSGDGGAGQVALERGWYEYQASDRFAVRAGKFLTPFGKYNLVHDATPTFTTSILPSSIYGKHSQGAAEPHRLYAKFSAGILVLGTLPLGAWDMQYWAYVANGRGSDSFEKDNNSNKAVGGRFLFSDSRRRISFGGSVYSERENETTDNALHTAVTGELTFSPGNFVLEAESVWARTETGDHTNLFTTKLGGYIQTEYTFAGRFTPVARIDVFDHNSTLGNDRVYDRTVGININITDQTFLKAETHFLTFGDPAISSYRMFISSVAVAF